MTGWIKRTFDAPGLTQYPSGPHLRAVQARFGGYVVLCLDVSGSMDGSPLVQAGQGCRRFIGEALDAGYEVAVVFWNHEVVASAALSRDRQRLMSFVSTARSHGGTNVVPALFRSHELLADRRGDRVVAIFGDGDLGDVAGARRKSDLMRTQDIRIITCGLGLDSAASLDTISSESLDGGPRAAQPDTIADSIAGMANGLRRRSRS